MLNTLKSIAQENRSQLLDSSETDPVQYISNRPGIDQLSQRYRVDVSYPETQFAYSRLTQRIQPSISSLRNEVQAHLKSTILLSLMVADLTLHAYSILRPILTSHHSLLTYDPTPCIPPNCVYTLCITLNPFILLHSKHIFFLPEYFESVAASTHRVSIFQTVNSSVQVRLIPLGPSKYLNLCLIGM